MNTLYALVLTLAMTNGDYQEAVIGVLEVKESVCRQQVNKVASQTAIQLKRLFRLTTNSLPLFFNEF